MIVQKEFLEMLRCPVSGQPVHQEGGGLAAIGASVAYRVSPAGIPLFAEELCTEDARRQQAHYERIAQQYLANLGYPHTREYMKYLDRAFLEEIGDADLGACAEVCCGGAEAFQLLDSRVRRGIGIDISVSMLEAARTRFPADAYCFVQGDATLLPLREGVLDSVVMLGGIHHVNDRNTLFREIFRVLKPGGRFYWREPVSDFFLWRWLRAVVYKVSPVLDSETERPLLYRETAAPLGMAGFRLDRWRTHGFFGYCLLMNSDVLFFNRALRFLPGIKTLTRLATRIDEWTTRLPGMERNGLIVTGMATKPHGGGTP
ncbi:MAG: class I SAM-dependent methyltransferase [Rugosibacter sp.]|nr:class I SAM-dependent methyltransferase [Rugosibacter sp.]